MDELYGILSAGHSVQILYYKVNHCTRLHFTVPRDTIMSPTANSIETQSPGVGQSGVADQYADGKAAKVTLNIWKQITIYKDDILIQYSESAIKVLSKSNTGQ